MRRPGKMTTTSQWERPSRYMAVHAFHATSAGQLPSPLPTRWPAPRRATAVNFPTRHASRQASSGPATPAYSSMPAALNRLDDPQSMPPQITTSICRPISWLTRLRRPGRGRNLLTLSHLFVLDRQHQKRRCTVETGRNAVSKRRHSDFHGKASEPIPEAHLAPLTPDHTTFSIRHYQKTLYNRIAFRTSARTSLHFSDALHH